MKKNSVSLISALIFAVALIITLPMRTLQYKNCIEAGTGFYTDINALVVIFYAIIAMAFVAFLVMSVVNRKKLTLDFEPKKRIPEGIVSFICGLLSVYGAVIDFTSNKEVFVPIYTVTSTSGTMLNYLAYTADLFAVLAGIYFALLGASFLTGKSCGESFKLISLAPPIWSAIRLIIRFTRTISYIRVSDLFLEMLMLACFALFFMSFAQANSKVNNESTEYKILSFGLTGAILGLVVAVPRLILTITGKTEMMYELSEFEIYDIGLALFCFVTSIERIKVKEN